MARRCSWVGATGPTSTPCSTADVASGGNESRVQHAVERAESRPRDTAHQPRGDVEHPPPVVEGEHHGHEHHRRGRNSPLQDRHLEHQRLNALGVVGRREQADVGAQRDAPEHGLLHSEVVEQGDHLVRVAVDAIGRCMGRLVAAPVAEQVQQGDSVTLLGEGPGDAAVELCVPSSELSSDADKGPRAQATQSLVGLVIARPPDSGGRIDSSKAFEV